MQHPRLDVRSDPGRPDAVLRHHRRTGSVCAARPAGRFVWCRRLARGQQGQGRGHAADAGGGGRAGADDLHSRRRRAAGPPGGTAELRMRWWQRRRLRTKIFLPFSVLILAILLATLWVVGAAVSAWVEGSLKRQFTATGNVFRALMAERADRLIGETSLLVSDFAFKRAIALYDPETMTSVAENYRGRMLADLLWITDETGRLFAASGRRVDPTTQLTAVEPLAHAMGTGEPAVAVTEVDGGLVQLVAVPVFGPEPIGYVLAGEAVDDATAQELQASTGPAVSFLTPARLFASSWKPDERAQLFPDAGVPPALSAQLARAAAAAGKERKTFLLDLRGERLLSTLIPIEDAQLPGSAPLF